MNIVDLAALIKRLYSTDDEPAYLHRFDKNAWYTLYALALEHKVDALLYKQLCRHTALFATIPAGIRRALRSIYQYNYNQNRYGIDEANRIAQACYEVGIRICAKRGLALLGDVYPDFGVRPLEDIDFIVSPHDLLATDSLLQAANYEILRINDQFATHLPDHATAVTSVLYKRKGNDRDCDRKLTVDVSCHSKHTNLQAIIDNSVLPAGHVQWRTLQVKDFALLLCQGLYEDALERIAQPRTEHCSLGKLIDLIGYTRIHPVSISNRDQQNTIVDYACTCANSLWNISLFEGEM